MTSPDGFQFQEFTDYVHIHSRDDGRLAAVLTIQAPLFFVIMHAEGGQKEKELLPKIHRMVVETVLETMESLKNEPISPEQWVDLIRSLFSNVDRLKSLGFEGASDDDLTWTVTLRTVPPKEPAAAPSALPEEPFSGGPMDRQKGRERDPEEKCLVGEDRSFGGNGLFVDLIPKSCWFINVRSCVTKESWDKIRRFVYGRAGYRCEVCGAGKDLEARRWIEAHERWRFDDTLRIQKLVRLIALCSNCHTATHFGLAKVRGVDKEAFGHLMKVTGMTEREANDHIREAFRIWEERSKHKYSLDLSILTDSGVELIGEAGLSGERSPTDEDVGNIKKPEDSRPAPVSDETRQVPPNKVSFWAPLLAGVSILGLAGWFVVSPPWKEPRPPATGRDSSSTAVVPQNIKYRIFHWTHGTFRCRIDHSVGKRPWACVRIGPPKKRVKAPMAKKPPSPVRTQDPVMSLPVWKGPWAVAWKFACAYEWNHGKWFAVNRPVLFDGHFRDPRTGVSQFAADRVRIECPK